MGSATNIMNQCSFSRLGLRVVDNAEPFSSNDGLTYYRRLRFLVSANSTRNSNSSNAGKSIRTKFRNDDSSVLSKSVNSLLYAPHNASP